MSDGGTFAIDPTGALNVIRRLMGATLFFVVFSGYSFLLAEVLSYRQRDTYPTSS